MGAPCRNVRQGLSTKTPVRLSEQSIPEHGAQVSLHRLVFEEDGGGNDRLLGVVIIKTIVGPDV